MLFNLGDQGKIQKTKHDNVFNTETMLPISEINNDTIILKDGWLRWILKVTGLNMDLRNFDEQEIVLQQYKRFLNWLDFPIQLLIRNTYLDLSGYLTYLKKNIKKIDNKELKWQWDAYTSFLEKIDSQQWLIYVKEFYIIVPFYISWDDNKEVNKTRYKKLMNILNAKDNTEKVVARYRWFLKWKSQLDTRCNLIIDGLNWLGIPVTKITTANIIDLLFRCYNPLLHNDQAKPNN